MENINLNFLDSLTDESEPTTDAVTPAPEPVKTEPTPIAPDVLDDALDMLNDEPIASDAVANLVKASTPASFDEISASGGTNQIKPETDDDRKKQLNDLDATPAETKRKYIKKGGALFNYSENVKDEPVPAKSEPEFATVNLVSKTIQLSEPTPEPIAPVTPAETPQTALQVASDDYDADDAKSMQLMTASIKKAKTKNTLSGLKLKDFENIFSAFKIQIQKALPKHLDTNRFISIISSIVAKNKDLHECTPESIISAVVSASLLGLNPALGECYFIPYNKKVGFNNWIKECRFSIGYKGYIKLMHNNSKIKSIYAQTVHATDEFTLQYGLNPKLKHIPDLVSEKTYDNITGVYAVVFYVNGGLNFVYLNKSEIEFYRKRSANQSTELSYIWLSDTIAMCQKTAIRRLANYIPLSDEMLNPFIADESGIDLNAIESGKIKPELLEREIADDENE